MVATAKLLTTRTPVGALEHEGVSESRRAAVARFSRTSALLSAVLIDVGGTLWPDRLTVQRSDDTCLMRLAALLPGLDPTQSLAVLRAALREDDQSVVQDTHAVLARALQARGVESVGLDVSAIRRALCAPAVPGITLFPGARELLETIRDLGLRCIMLSNVQVRGSAEYWPDFADLRIAHLIHAVVTSLDVGFRKPHPAMFQAGLEAAGCTPAESVMVGDYEVKDIQPAVSLGMRAIHVAIEEPPPAASCAQSIMTSLSRVQPILRQWAADRPD